MLMIPLLESGEVEVEVGIEVEDEVIEVED